MKSIWLALYVVVVSIAYLILYELYPSAADRAVGLVVVALLLPAVVFEVSWWKRGAS
jgi:glucose-6-phosphate dehydrogenase assembly protein OpcA